MRYRKVKRTYTLDDGTEEKRDYLQWKGRRAIYEAKDTEAGKESLDKRRRRR